MADPWNATDRSPNMQIAIPEKKWKDSTHNLPGLDARAKFIAEEFDKLGCFHGFEEQELRNRLIEIKGVGTKTVTRFIEILLSVGAKWGKAKTTDAFKLWRIENELASVKNKLRRLEGRCDD